MTRLAVLADVHGNLPALEAVLADARQFDLDGIVVAGDLVHGAPQSEEVVCLLRSLGAWMIRGNNDDYLSTYDAGDGPDGWYTSKQWSPLRWTYSHLDRELLDFIGSLPEQRMVALDGAAPIRVVHGSPNSSSGQLFPDLDPVSMNLFWKAGFLTPDCEPPRLELTFAQITEPVLVCGHTHIPWSQQEGERLVLNPGAVCGSLHGDVRAQYALLAWQNDFWRVEHRAVAYDLAQVRAAFCESGLLAEGGAFARSILLTIETGQNVAGHFVSHTYKVAAEAGFGDCDVVPDTIWEHAVATFDWDNAARLV